MKKQPKEPRTKRLNRFPKGWNEKKVHDLINHYDNQSDEDAAREDDAAYSNPPYPNFLLDFAPLPRLTYLPLALTTRPRVLQVSGICVCNQWTNRKLSGQKGICKIVIRDHPWNICKSSGRSRKLSLR